MLKKIALVVGTRPEAIKIVPVYFALRQSRTLEPILVSTGQHKEMLMQTFDVFGIRPDFDLELMQPGQTLPDLTARVLTGLISWLREAKPSALLVQGDTTSAFAAGLAAFYERIPVGHVEAGLRTYDILSPWPEEANRRLIAPLARWAFAPTNQSRANLIGERVPESQVHVTGNTVVDSLLWVRNHQASQSEHPLEKAQRLSIPGSFANSYLNGFITKPNHEQPTSNSAPRAVLSPDTCNLIPKSSTRWILVTGHRRESFGQGFEQICEALLHIVEEFPDVGILYPVHLNPKVQEPVKRLLGNQQRIALIPPVGYEDFVWLMDRAHFILSDSGGVQEEAPSLGKPVLVMRETTERPEGVDAGTCVLVGTNPKKILTEVRRLLNDEPEYHRRSQLKNPYGDGKAARRIVEILEKDLG